MKRETTIAIQQKDDIPRKITKLVQLKDGFAIMVPYHNANEGYLFKHIVDYDKMTEHLMMPDDMVSRYTATSKVKLSFHLDGFVHFSGHGIRSGYDSATDEVKGLGLKGDCPIEISTGGPAFSLSIWGISDYPAMNKQKGVEVFTNNDFYFNGSAEERNGFLIEGFLMPKHRFSEGITRKDGSIVWIGFLPKLSIFAYPFTLRVIDLLNQPHFLGILVTSQPMSFPSPSGFALVGPSFCPPDKKLGYGITACYPRPQGVEQSESLDFVPKSNSTPATS